MRLYYQLRILFITFKKTNMDRTEFKFDGKPLTYEQLYMHLGRAEDRLTRNLNSSHWTFVQYTGIHFAFLGFIYAIFSMQSALLVISYQTIALVIAIGGSILHLASLMSMNKYRSHVQANEKVITKLEILTGDPQQEVEQEQKVRFPSGAGTARKIIFWVVWITEIGIAIMLYQKM